MFEHKEIIELLSLVTNKLDRHEEYGSGDVMFLIINSLKEEWNLD